MPDQWICGADDCTNIVADDQLELVELPVDGTGEWVETSEYDEEQGLEITEWTGKRETVNVANCAACHEQQQALIAELEAMNQTNRTR